MSAQDAVIISGAVGSVMVAGASLLRLRGQKKTANLQIEKLQSDVQRAQANRLALLETFADQSVKYRRELRSWLTAYVESGAIDMSRIDMDTMPQPPDWPLDYTP